ncbi:MAG: Asp-tRNA(Asn)/Glu-tRNA(Gln) amidotransferase subunit GatA [Pseudomonadota bacterium]
MPTTVRAQLEALNRGALSSVELCQALLERTGSLEHLNVFISLNDRLLDQAAAADEARAGGSTLGQLHGLPLAHKDIFMSEGLRTTCGSRMLQDFIAPYTATALQRFADAGALVLGKCNMDEFAMGSSNENSFFGSVANPWDADRVPGGSSGGSAACVAAGLAAAATGTDTGGSIRQPAAFCGVSGIKPTYGRVSRYGMVAFASSLDQGGVMARTAADLALLLANMQGFDPQDSTSIETPDLWLENLKTLPIETLDEALTLDAKLTVGLPQEYFDSGSIGARAMDDIRTVIEVQGHRVQDVSLPNTGIAIPAYYVIAGAEASTNLSRYDGVRFGHRANDAKDLETLYRRSRSEGFGTEVKRRILTGTYALSVGYYEAYYLKAQQLRRLISDDFKRAFADVDVLLTPTTPTTAFERGAVSNPVTMYQQDVFTVPASLAGLPALSLPCGFKDGLPLGAQLIGPHYAERSLLCLAHQIQSHSDWHEAVAIAGVPA